MKFSNFSVFSCILLGVASVGFAQLNAPSTPRDQLKQYVSELKQFPNDQALRERIIKLALTLEPKPAIPEDAERFNARGKAAVKDAQSPQDFADAAKEFEKATLAAPWLANPYYNLADVQGKAGDYAKGAQNLKFYLLAAPDAQDAKAVKELMYEMEFKAEKAAKAKTEQEQREQVARAEQRRREENATAERRRQDEIAAAQRAEADRIARAKQEKVNALKAKYDGAVWVWPDAYTYEGVDCDSYIRCNGTVLEVYGVYRKGRLKGMEAPGRAALKDLSQVEGNRFRTGDEYISHEWLVSDDGQTITETGYYNTESFRGTKVHVYKRQK